MNEFDIGDLVRIQCWDDARFEGVLEDFDAERDYFTLHTLKGLLGFPFGHVRTMEHA